MNVIDMTHTISKDMPVYPGTDKPDIVNAFTISDNGFSEKKITFFSHIGTHMDAPAHILTDGKSLDAYDPNQFYGRAIVIACDSVEGMITENMLRAYSEGIGMADFVLLHTGWHKKWGTQDYFESFPTLSRDAARWIASQDVKGVGVDCISVDAVDSEEYSIHRILLGAGMVIVENLTNLEALPATPFLFSCLPLKIADADGAPVRAVGIVE